MHQRGNRKDALRRYAIARMKDIELIHLNLILWELRQHKFAPENIMGHTSEDFAASVQTVALAWFATLVDQSHGGLNIFDLWRQLFPGHGARIEAVWKKIEPAWKIIRSHRNKVAFHADEPLGYFKAKLELYENMGLVHQALDEFMGLSAFFMKVEDDELPELGKAAREMTEDIGQRLGFAINPDYFSKIITTLLDNGVSAGK